MKHITNELEIMDETIAQLREYFNLNYSYMTLPLTYAELLHWLYVRNYAKLSLSQLADMLSDYLLANGLSEVQE